MWAHFLHSNGMRVFELECDEEVLKIFKKASGETRVQPSENRRALLRMVDVNVKVKQLKKSCPPTQKNIRTDVEFLLHNLTLTTGTGTDKRKNTEDQPTYFVRYSTKRQIQCGTCSVSHTSQTTAFIGTARTSVKTRGGEIIVVLLIIKCCSMH